LADNKILYCKKKRLKTPEEIRQKSVEQNWNSRIESVKKMHFCNFNLIDFFGRFREYVLTY